jgi:SRSO17 transposase
MTHVDRRGRFEAYLDALSPALGRPERKPQFKAYCMGLTLPGDRKSIEPIAARVATMGSTTGYQSLHRFVAESNWSDEALLNAVRTLVLPALTRYAPIRAWVVEDVTFAKRGSASVGVARQLSPRGVRENCQVAVTLSIGSARGTMPVAYRLYLPAIWANSPTRREKASVPDPVVFQTRPQIALDQIGAAVAAGVPKGLVLAPAAYGADADFCTGLTALGLDYALQVEGSRPLWTQDIWGEREPAGMVARKGGRLLLRALGMVTALPAGHWRAARWRDSMGVEFDSRFAAVRVGTAQSTGAPAAEPWLVAERRNGHPEPTNTWLSTLANAGFSDFMHRASLQWRVTRDLQELKDTIGLGHYEGRGWRGHHHHASLCVAAYGYLLWERNRSL